MSLAPRLLRSLKGETLDRPPIWFMRQAGRFLPEYRELRAKAPDFMAFCKTPAMAAEATLGSKGRGYRAFAIEVVGNRDVAMRKQVVLDDRLECGLRVTGGGHS